MCERTDGSVPCALASASSTRYLVANMTGSAARLGGSPGPVFVFRMNYYRLSGYWYPMRRFSQGDGTAQDKFVDGASFDLVVALYRFEEQLRHSVFIELDRVELAIRTKLGHELGRLDPLIYLDPQRLNARARQRNKDGRSVHEVWLRKYQSALKASKEDFVAHHKSKYGGTLPIWAVGR